MIRSTTYGRKSVICPPALKKLECYEPCEHTGYVLENSLPFIGNPIYLESLLRGQLTVAEQFLAELCDPIDICVQGERLGFPCVQCDYVYTPAFSLCALFEIKCGDCSYTTIDPCSTFCTDVCADACITGVVDFTTAVELTDIYTIIIEALRNFSGAANWLGIEEMGKLIFGETAKVVLFDDGKYYLYVGEISDVMRNALIIINRLFPAPIGSSVVFVENEVCI